MVNEDLKVNPMDKRYVIMFKRKDQRPNRADDKVEILKRLMRVGDFENYVDITALKPGDKRMRYNKVMSSGRNETDTFNPITPNLEVIHDINRYDFPVVMAKLSTAQYHRVRKDPNIQSVEAEHTIYPEMSFSQAPQQTVYGVSHVKAPEAWESSKFKKGRGVYIAVIDSGIYNLHPDLTDNYVAGFSATFSPNTTSPIDEGTLLSTTVKTIYYHGTHVAGIAAAADNTQGVVGVAPEASLVSLRIFNKTTVGTTSTIALAATQYAMDKGFDVINNSWGSYTFSQAEQTLYQQIRQLGLITVCAEGNDGIHNLDATNPALKGHFPSDYPDNIAISGTVEANDAINPAFNYGKQTQLAAPGTNILSTYHPSVSQGYFAMSGTSMATPHVSGMFALGLASYRFFPCSDMYKSAATRPEVLRLVARSTATKIGGFTDRDPADAYGYGFINCDALVKKLLNPDIHVGSIA
jgi:subtilisin family serine protease